MTHLSAYSIRGTIDRVRKPDTYFLERETHQRPAASKSKPPTSISVFSLPPVEPPPVEDFIVPDVDPPD